ncbi:hypothetical protein RF11_12400 [Thelohanellus kitauei]|uniref:Vacuolar protein sorting/targeting protein 10 n=1 Tax=Thelohanellus kitauei TaxID=669202 RepID=A0A0C2ICM3_THEKT|nr:hypothetical protein RF11_12400 [Thelohanellus kitauei]
MSVHTQDYDVKYELVSDYKIFEGHILVMQPIARVTYKLYIIDARKKTHEMAHFPSLLKINDVKFFEYAFGNYYIVLVHQDLTTCLWTTTSTPFHFVRKICYNEPISGSMKSNIHIDKGFEGQIYMNLPSIGNILTTHRTTDDGRFWDIVKFKDLNSENDAPVKFNFEFHDPHSVPIHFGFIDIQYKKLKDGLQPFLTTDGGHSWNPMPITAIRPILLNYETVILSINRDLSAINYSYDKGTTWLTHKLFTKSHSLYHFGRLSDTDLKVLIVTRGSEDDELRFSILDFSNIFSLYAFYHRFRVQNE